jgi:hypothetical protein
MHAGREYQYPNEGDVPEREIVWVSEADESER